MSTRRQVNSAIRQTTFDWLERQGYAHTPSHANHFMVETKRSAKEVIAAMAKQNVFIGRVWPAVPTHVRVTVGTADEMMAFQEAFRKVMASAVTARALPATIGEPVACSVGSTATICLDGLRLAGFRGTSS